MIGVRVPVSSFINPLEGISSSFRNHPIVRSSSLLFDPHFQNLAHWTDKDLLKRPHDFIARRDLHLPPLLDKRIDRPQRVE